MGWVAEGKVKIRVGHTFPLDRAREAFALMERTQKFRENYCDPLMETNGGREPEQEFYYARTI